MEVLLLINNLKNLIMRKISHLLFIGLATVLLLSCSNENDNVIVNEADLLENIDLDAISKMGEFTEPVSKQVPVERIISVDTLFFETEEQLIGFFEKRGTKINLDSESENISSLRSASTNALDLNPITPGSWSYTLCSKTGYTSRIQNKSSLYLLDTSAASYIEKNTGYYVVYTYTVKLEIPYTENYISGRYRTSYKDFFYEDSPNCGYINAIWNSGYIAIKGKDRGYAQEYTSSGLVELTTRVVEVVADRSGNKVNKWLPCHIDDIVWNYGRMAATFSIY